MAYNSTDFMVGRGQVNCEANTYAPAYHSYTTTDTLATVTAASYFSENFNFPEGCVIDNDIIWIHALDGRGFFTVTDVTSDPVLSTNITPPSITTYSTGVSSLTFSGPFSGTQSVAYNYVKNGTQVTLTFEPLNKVYNAGAIIISDDDLPALLRPSTAVYGAVNVVNASVNAPGYMVVSETGQVVAGTYESLNHFTSGNVGWLRIAMTYQLPDA